MTEKTETKKVKSGRRLVIPEETIVSGDDYLPGDFTQKQGKDIISQRYGLRLRGKITTLTWPGTR